MSGPLDERQRGAVRVERGPGRGGASFDVSRWLTPPVWGLLLAMLLGTVVLFVAAAEEPYHIDELRQVRAYGLPLGEIPSRTFAQTQPPLDALLNALVQRVLGVGDVVQRGLSVLFGLAAGVLLGRLARTSDDDVLVPSVTVLVLWLIPLFVAVTAYARPYALPVLLVVAHLTATQRYLATGTWRSLAALSGLSLVLPLSRTTEPLMFLGLVVLLVPLHARLVGAEWRGRPGWVSLSSAAGAVFVGLPVVIMVRSAGMDEFTSDRLVPTVAQLSRLVTDLPSVVGSAVLPLWAIFPLLLIAGASRGVRGRARSAWWYWVLWSLPLTFALVFFARAEATQPYYDRYAFTFAPPLAVTAAWVAEEMRTERHWMRGGLTVVVLAVVVLSALTGTLRMLTTNENGDWEQASRTIMETVPEGILVALEHPRGLGQYRSPFAGTPRYLPAERFVPKVEQLVSEPERVGPDQEVVVLLADHRPNVDGWARVPAGHGFRLYLPEDPVRGPADAGRAFLTFARSLPDEVAGTFWLAGISLLEAAGETDAVAAAWREALRVAPQPEALIAEAGRRGLSPPSEVP